MLRPCLRAGHLSVASVTSKAKVLPFDSTDVKFIKMDDSEIVSSDSKRRKCDSKSPTDVDSSTSQSCSFYADEDTKFNFDAYVKEELLSDDEVEFEDDVKDEPSWDSEDELDPLNLEDAIANPDEQWSDNSSSIKQFPFLKREALVQPTGTEPIDYFTLLFDQEIMESIIQWTNSRAFEMHCAEGVTDKSRITHWKELTLPEFNVFIGLLLHTGTISLHQLSSYWKKDPLFNLQCFMQHMSRNRFWLILKCLSFAPKSEPEVVHHLQQVSVLINHFNQKMNTIFCPGRELTLDEPIILWKGRVFPQYKSERIKRGMKLYMLTTPEGIVVKFGANAGPLQENGVNEQTEKMVMHLVDETLDNGHSLHVDQTYCSISVARKLLDRDTQCTGVLKSGSRGIPKTVKDVKLKTGNIMVKYNDRVMVAKCRDNATTTLFMSSEFANILDAIASYEKLMFGVNRQDHMLSYYPCERIVLRWHLKIFIHIVQMSLINAFHLYNIYSGNKMALYDFRLSVIRELLKTSETRPIRVFCAVDKQQEEHVMKKCAKSKNGSTLRRKCKSCGEKGIRRETVYECAVCPEAAGYCLDCCKLTHS